MCLRLLLHRFVLVAQLVGLEAEQVGEILGALLLLSAATTAAAATAHLHLHVAVQGFGALQMLQRTLLTRECARTLRTAQLFLGALELHAGGVELPLDLRERRVVGGNATIRELLRQLADILAQASFCNRECGDVLTTLLGLRGRAVA